MALLELVVVALTTLVRVGTANGIRPHYLPVGCQICTRREIQNCGFV